MAGLITLQVKTLRNRVLESQTQDIFLGFARWASKKTGSSTKNKRQRSGQPTHYGWKHQEGSIVYPGTMLVKQRTLRFHPGLNVGLSRNGSLFALEHGKVVVTCELTDLNWEHSWVQRMYQGRADKPFYKKYYNIVQPPQEGRFKLIDRV